MIKIGKKLIIAEKPDISRTIQRALYNEKWNKFNGYAESENYICTNCFGDLFELYSLDDYFNREKSSWNLDEIPFIPNIYKYNIKNNSGVKEQVKIIDDLIKRNDVDIIINAGDADAEGNRLVNQMINYSLNKNKLNKNVMRLWFTDQSEPSIRQDIRNIRPISEYANYDNQATARLKIDWAIGINYSVALTLIASSEKSKVTLRQGRVLGTIVKFIYDRYKEQEKFIPENYFNISLVLNDEDKSNIVVKGSIFKEEEQLKALSIMNSLNTGNIYISKVEKNNKKKYPKNLFSLTTLQNTVNKKFKLSSKEVLSSAQKLYEKGFITYPRTSSEYLATNSSNKVKATIEAYKVKYNNISFKETKHLFDDSKVDSHEAIIPTAKIPNDLSGNEKVVYEVIRNRFLANFAVDECVIEETSIIISNSYDKEYAAEIKGTKILKKGFLEFEDIIKEVIVPDYKEGDRVDGTYVLNSCVTKAPANVTPSELNNFLESPTSKEEESADDKYKKILEGLEIGTVATRADIIENAIKYNYIEEKKGVYVITKLGIYFIETAEQLGLLMDVNQNVTIGRYLKAVFNGKITKEQCVDTIEKFVTNNIMKAKKLKVEEFVREEEKIADCPICKKNILEGNKVFYCEGIKDKSCDFSIFKNDIFLTSKGKTVTKSLVKALITKRIVKVSGLKKKDNSGLYDAYIKIYKNGNYYNLKFADKEDIPQINFGTCMRCGKEILRNDKAYYCSGFRDENKCTFTLWKSNKFLEEKGIKLSESNYKALLKGKKVLIKGIKSKDGNAEYNANLYIEDTGTFVNYKIETSK